MKRVEGFTKRITIIVLTVALIFTGFVGCGKSASNTPTDTTYKLTHSAADAEYIIGWDSIVSRYPVIGDYSKIEAFAHRGETVQITSGEDFGLDDNSPAAWASTRFIRTEWQGESYRSFGVMIVYFETAQELDEYLHMPSIIPGMTQDTPFREDGDFKTVTLETDTPLKSIHLLLAGKHFAVIFIEFASLNESLFLNKDALNELLLIAKVNISLSETTPFH